MNDFSNLTVIIPTLNEAGSISKLISLLSGKYRHISIIVSDDGSTDGTKEIVNRISRRNRRVRFIDRKNKKTHGITASVLDAASSVRTGKIIVMDGDMQHPYQKVGEIARALDNFNLVIGVRSRVKDWGVHRMMVSKSLSTFAYLIFKSRGKKVTKDMMSGFFGIKTRLFRSLINHNKEEFVGRGYKVLLDILRVVDAHEIVGEVYYGTFHGREGGKSKLKMLGLSQSSNTLKSILK